MTSGWSATFLISSRNGLCWRDAPAECGPHRPCTTAPVRWNRLAVLNRIFAGLADRAGEPERLMIDAPHLEAHRTAASLIKRGCSRCLGRSKGGLNSKLHAVCEGQGRPVVLLLSEGQISDPGAQP